ncbi:MAG TPA: energy transducer TonB [Terriglobales bacterium]|nr:energy transducer TonB [Terriglobales bacterium]
MTDNIPSFAPLPDGPSRAQRMRGIGRALAIETAIFAVVMAVPATRAPIIRAIAPAHTVLLYVPPPPPPKVRPPRITQPVREVIHRPAPLPTPVRLAHFDPPKIVAPRPVKAVKPVPRPTQMAAALSPLPKLSPTPDAAALRRPVQLAGFGSPAGVTGVAHSPVTNVAHLGDFGSAATNAQPSGGNGRGVQSAGFGDAADGHGGGGGNGNGNGRGVQSAGFGDGAAAASPARAAVAAAEAISPVEILYKPEPKYTPEARSAGIQGEVLIRVSFLASGNIEVGGLVRGLGYGLDQQALEVAREIRFKPATRNGQPISTNAIVHVLFQLAE